MNNPLLDIFRPRSRETIHIGGFPLQRFRFKEQLMSCLIFKTNNLILNRRTITRSNTLDYSTIPGRFRKMISNNLMGLLIRISQITGNPIFDFPKIRCFIGKSKITTLSVFWFKIFKINGIWIETRRSSRLKPKPMKS